MRGKADGPGHRDHLGRFGDFSSRNTDRKEETGRGGGGNRHSGHSPTPIWTPIVIELPPTHVISGKRKKRCYMTGPSEKSPVRKEGERLEYRRGEKTYESPYHDRVALIRHPSIDKKGCPDQRRQQVWAKTKWDIKKGGNQVPRGSQNEPGGKRRLGTRGKGKGKKSHSGTSRNSPALARGRGRKERKKPNTTPEKTLNPFRCGHQWNWRRTPKYNT